MLKPMTSIYEYETGNFKSKLLDPDQIDYFFYYYLTKWLLETIREIILQDEWKTEKRLESCSSHGRNSSLTEVPLATHLLRQEDKYGRFGRLRLSSEADFHSEPTFIFQEISGRIVQQKYRADRYLESTLAVWDYSLPTGSILLTARLEDGDGDEDEDEEDSGTLQVLLFFVSRLAAAIRLID